MTETKPQVVDTVPESYVRTSGLQFIDGVLHQLFVSGHTGGEGVWVAVPGQEGGVEVPDPAPKMPSPLPTAPVAPLSALPPAVLAPAPTPAPVPTEQGMQVQSPGQEG